jgi:hypothetical protein
VEDQSPEDQPQTPEARALRAIADELAELRREHSKPIDIFEILPSFDPEKRRQREQTAREKDREEREREQAKLYRLIVLFAAVSAIASLSSVVVAVLAA